MRRQAGRPGGSWQTSQTSPTPDNTATKQYGDGSSTMARGATAWHTVDHDRPRAIVSVVPAWRTDESRLTLRTYCRVGGRWHHHHHGACRSGCLRKHGYCVCPLGSGDGHRATLCTPLGTYIAEQPGSPPVRGPFGRGWRDQPRPDLGMVEIVGVGL
jgi:hypothetical protein